MSSMEPARALSSGGLISIKAENAVVKQKDGTNLKPGEYVKIVFADNGPVISEKFAANIFDPFFSTKQGNQGLGLAISQSIIVRHGGTIMVETMGFEVKAVTDGQQVIEELITNRVRFRAVILNLTVPGRMGGKEACEIIRNSGQSLPVFAASRYAADPIIKDPEKFGFDGSIAKPFTINSLNQILEKLSRDFDLKDICVKLKKNSGARHEKEKYRHQAAYCSWCLFSPAVPFKCRRKWS